MMYYLFTKYPYWGVFDLLYLDYKRSKGNIKNVEIRFQEGNAGFVCSLSL